MNPGELSHNVAPPKRVPTGPGDNVPAGGQEPGSRALDEALRSSLRILKFVMVLVTFAVVFSGVLMVEPNEVAIVLRFGRPAGVGSGQILKPGLHWAFPYPVDEIVRVPAGQTHSVVSATGWYATTPEQQARGEEPPPRGTLTPGADGYLITADGNIIHARATLKYRIADPVRFAFALRNPTNLVRTILDNALLHGAARYSAEAAIYRDKLGFRDAVLARLTDQVARYRIGISVDLFDVQVVAPADVRAAFEAVLAAEQERSQRISEAAAYASEATLKSKGQAEAAVSEGRTTAHRYGLAVAAEAEFFEDQLPHYRANPTLFRRRWLAETMQGVLTNAQDTFLLPKAAGDHPNQVRLQLNREPPRQSPKDSSKP